LSLIDFAMLPSDSYDLRLQKRLQVAMALASMPVVGLWGLLFVAGGHARLGLWHAGYIGGTLLLLLHLAVSKRYEVFRLLHPLLVMLAPFGLHFYLGGFRGSGGALLWSLLAPMAGMMFVGARHSWPLFATMIALVGAGWLRDGPWAPAHYQLSPSEVAFHFAFNASGFVAFLYLSTRYFVARIEKEKHRAERLLLNVLPAPIAERLKQGEATIADRYESVTVLFADIAGFTPLAAKLNAHDVVVVLDEIFSAFDAIADRHALEKIKTIGDAYMLVGGLPQRAEDHAQRVARAALEMCGFIERFAAERGFAITMRIGIHSGDVVAGVIGRRKFSYDLWGDTVNTASRMESHGAPGRVHVSEATRARLDGEFHCSERGSIAVKGKGEMRTFWVER
jgi:guanylate cyclase